MNKLTKRELKSFIENEKKMEFVPQLGPTESDDDFITRCMGDEEMVDSFPDNPQRAVICNSQLTRFAKKDEEKKKRKRDQAYEAGFEIEQEIFAVGLWNGMEFTTGDLKMISNAFHTLKENHHVPLKLGHNEDQPFSDGQPALGWVDDVFVQGDKLIAKFVGVPEVVKNAIDAGLYRHVSIELDMSVEHGGQMFPLVLSGVALLGADIPAVNNLEDLSALMSRDDVHGERRASFTSISNQTRIQEMNEIERLKAEVDAGKAVIVTLTTDKTTAEAKALEFEAKDVNRQATDKKAKFTAEQKTLIVPLDEMVKAEKISPAQRDTLMAEAVDDTSLATVKFTVARLSEIVGDGEKTLPKDEKGKVKPTEKGDDDEKDITKVMLDRVQVLRAENPSMNFTQASNMVFAAHPKDARTYIMYNGGDDV